MDFSEKQKQVFDFLCNETGSALVTGVAGCGKSTIVRAWLATPAGQNAMVLAPTGIAALNVGGSTIHRAFSFRPNMNAKDPRISLQTKSLLYNVKTIVVDEVSMVRGDLLSAMDIVLRSVKRKPATPFGGVRMILVGDFFQLPPVVPEAEERWMESTYGSRAGWCFYTPAFQALAPKIFYLAESFRQAGDGSFTALLNAVRALDPNVVRALNEIAKPGSEAGGDVPRLCARKADVATRNSDGLRKLGAQTYAIQPVLSGDTTKIPKEETDSVVLAEGARVMITKNGAGYVNGSLGHLRTFDAMALTWDGLSVPALGIELDNGVFVTVPRNKKEVFGYEIDPETGEPAKVEIAAVEQYGVMLAYAWTIHKSQGQTLEAACIDLGRGAFAHGQAYVALSRLTSAAGLYLAQPLQKSDLLLDPDVVEYFKAHSV